MKNTETHKKIKNISQRLNTIILESHLLLYMISFSNYNTDSFARYLKVLVWITKKDMKNVSFSSV